MIDFIKKWSKKHFKLYLLIYAAQVDHREEDEELDIIKSKFNEIDINRIYKDTKQLNDYHRCQIIINFINSNHITQDELDGYLMEIKEIFNSDGSFEIVEQQSYYMLKKLLKA